MSNVTKLLLIAALLLLPASAHAQTTLAGTVRDASGAVLPGVTVEASSPVMIEKSRAAVTDGTGQYRIENLQPGTYTVTYSLTGFITVKRDSVDVSGAGVVSVNVEMRVGGIQETITVTGETPIVDVQSTRRQTVLSEETVQDIPATRGYNAILTAIPSVTGGSQQIDLTPQMRIFTSHGGRGNEGRVQVDGLNVGAAFNGGGVSGYIMDTSNAQELQFNLSGGLGEAEVGGMNLNIVPKTGGNTFSGQIFGNVAGSWSQGSNIDDNLRAFGIIDPAALLDNWDVSGSIGGPILRDKLWFLFNLRNFGEYSVVPGAYGNLNAGDPTKWTYVTDLSVQGRNANTQTIASARLTYQITPRNKVGFYVDQQWVCQGTPVTVGDAESCRGRMPRP
jgi:Carboxypeptidase regulatory-like domain